MSDSKSEEGSVAGRRPIDSLRDLKTTPLNFALIGASVLWILYLVSGYRSPLDVILLSDKDASAVVRQLVFATTGMLAIAQLVLNRALGALIVTRWALFSITGLLFLSALWSQDPPLTIKRSIIFLFGAFTVATLVHSTPNPARFMMRFVVYFCGAVSLISIALHLLLPEGHTVNPGRPGLAGISQHPNTLAPFLSIGLILSMGMRETSKSRIIAWHSMRAFLAIGLLMTLSITTILTTLVGLFLYILLSSNSYRRGAIQIILFIVALMVGVIGASTIKSGIFSAIGRDESLSGRDELWKVVWYEVGKQPLIGHGFGAFWTEGKGRELVQTWNPRQSHHAYLDLLVDLGPLGLGIVLALFPLSLLWVWLRSQGSSGGAKRKAMAAMMAAAFSYMTVYGFGESFFLKYDKFPFFIIVWITLIFTNRDTQCLSREFSDKRIDLA